MSILTKSFVIGSCMFFVLAMPTYAQDVEASGNEAANYFNTKLVKFSAGISYRNFHSTKVRGNLSRQFTGAFAQSGKEGDVQSYEAGMAKVGKDDFGNAFRDVAVVVHKDGGAMEASGDFETPDKFGPSIGASFAMWHNDNFSLSAVADFQYYNIDNRVDYHQGAEYSTYQSVIPGIPPAPERDAHDTDYLYDSSNTKMNLELFALDLGLRLDYNLFDACQIFIAAGPTITFSQMDADVNATLRRRTDGMKLSMNHDSSDSHDWIPGLYASLGLEYWFGESFGTSLEIRYDNAFEDAETRYAVQPLDSYSGAWKLLFRF